MRNFWILLCLFLLLPVSAAADPRGPVSVAPAPEGQGESFVPGVRLVADLPAPYIEDEYLVSGAATVYNYRSDPPARGDIVPLLPDLPYTTRMIIRRPADPAHFNGTVVVEWWNSTGTFDTAPVWDPSAEYFAREGYVYVGFTNSTTSIDHLVGNCRTLGILPPSCGTRYAALEMSENGQAFEMASQISHLLRSDVPHNPLYPSYPVEELLHAGQSQQGGSIVTYASAFHFEANDGYFIQAASSARPINFLPRCGDAGVPTFPGCTPRLVDQDRRVSTQLPVPVYRAMTETDVARSGGTTRQFDDDRFRYYEIAGAAHTHVHDGVEILPASPLGPALLLEDFCTEPLNTMADGPVFGSHVYNAMWDNLRHEVRTGEDSPVGRDIETEGTVVVRDADGNAEGGIRPTAMQVPTGSYGPINFADPTLPPLLNAVGSLFCGLSGTSAPFSSALLDERYPTHAGYVAQVRAATEELMDDGFLLEEDAAILVATAETSSIGADLGRLRCGIGFEIAFALLPIAAWRARRRA